MVGVDLSARRLEALVADGPRLPLFPARMAGFLQNIPYTATAEQVAAVTVFPARDDASGVNGVIVLADGGRSAV